MDQTTTAPPLDQLAAARDWAGLATAARAQAAAQPEAWEPAYHLGRALFELGQFDEAGPFLEDCMQRFPNLPQFAVLYGYVGTRALPPEAALHRWEALHARLPGAPGVRVGLCHAYRAAGEPARAEDIVAGGLATHPDNIPLLVQYADLAMQRSDWPAAIERWHAVHVRAPQRLDVQAALIGALRQGGRLDEARNVAAQALAANPDDPDLNTAYAAVAAAQQNWPDVAASLRRVIARTPDNLSASLGLVAALRRLQQADAAEAAAEAALAHHPDNEMLLADYAGAATDRQSWQEAATRWKTVLDRCPPRPLTYLRLIEALRKSGDLDQAEVVANEAVGFAPDDRALAIQHAEIATARLDLAESQTRWMKLKRRFPDDAEIIEGALKARKALADETKQRIKDEKTLARTPVKGSMRPPARPLGPPRGFNPGPLAIDMLISGQNLPPPVPPKPKPGVLKRLFGF